MVTANESPIDGAGTSIMRRVRSKLPIGGTEANPDTGSITNKTGSGTATFSGYLTDDANVINFTLTDWTVTGADGKDYIANGPMKVVYTMVLFNDGGSNTDSHYSGAAHYHIYVDNSSDGLELTRASDKRTAKIALTTDYWAEEEAGSLIVTHETYGKVDGKDIATIIDTFNVSLQ